MPKLEQTDEINAPVDAVWNLLSDVNRYPEWVEATDRIISAPEGLLEAGSEYKVYGGVPPFKSETEWKVTEFEPNRRQVHTGGDGMMEMRIEYDLSENGSGTTVTRRFYVQSKWWMRPVNMVMWFLMMRRRGMKVMADTGDNAKRILESEAPAAGAGDG